VNNFTIAPGRQAIDTSCATDYISKHSGYQVGLHAYKFSVSGILFERKTYDWQIKNELDTNPCMHIKACQRSATSQ
jgi:hypothetical protein